MILNQSKDAGGYEQTARWFLTIGLGVGVMWLLAYVADVLVPLVLALLLAYLLDPSVRQIERILKKRSLAVLTALALWALLIGVTGKVVVPTMASEFQGLVRIAQEATRADSSVRVGLEKRLPSEFLPVVNDFLKSDEVRRFVRENTGFQSAVLSVMRRLLPTLWGMVSQLMSVAGFLIQGLLVLLYLVFFLIDLKAFQTSWKLYLPQVYRRPVVSFVADFNDAMAKYFRGQFVVASVVGILFATGFWIIGLKMAVILGCVLGLMNMVPYLQIAGIVPALVLAVATAVDEGGALGPYLMGIAIVFAVVQLLQDAVVTPRVMGKVTGLRPVIILFSVFFWGKLLGFLGVLLAIPLTCLGVAYYRRLLGVLPADESA